MRRDDKRGGMRERAVKPRAEKKEKRMTEVFHFLYSPMIWSF